MAEPFFAELRITPYSQVPKGWAVCDGQIIPIVQNQALFSLLGTTYGGDGRTTFALPDLRGRTPIHASSNTPLGSKGGEATHVLATSEIPPHTHSVLAVNTEATSASPTNNFFANNSANPYLPNPTSLVLMQPTGFTPSGPTAGHQNMQPYLTLQFIIALQGVYPSRS